MKRLNTLFIIIAAAVLTAVGQVKTTKLAVYKEFKPSQIQLKDGRLINQNLTNIFLKNSSLLYLQGTNVTASVMTPFTVPRLLTWTHIRDNCATISC